MKPPPLRLLSLASAMAVAMLGLAQPAVASTIFWGSSIGVDVLIDSNGQPLGGEFSFEMGVFDNGFVPTVTNINDWAANWRVFDIAFDPTPTIPDDGDPEGWSEENQAFAGTVDHLSDGTSDSPYATPGFQFQQGTVVYLWVYNTKDRVTETEWALVTDGVNTGDTLSDWVFPDPAEVAGSYDWMLGDADSAVYGGLSDNGGGGVTLQTLVVPVPEPGSVLLLGVTVLGALLHRRRPIKTTTC
ncbi:PEP-CTERM protein-sorting domain-containing protein [Prosthecobacter debontii]|uniref:PEP-CTERM protein-sorting domain-containing protein n=1 Tax=Prosthecobacter debontii TaxID=48467 RepID=A0A1T4Z0Z6_9BACT|nr:PEP-CTERM sorting domain-containing protein [Prosthecobacter debontii]SKB07241.1 PEP-CTERM protein-sorting domain-containing protein [Prosthecobacter debontii]